MLFLLYGVLYCRGLHKHDISVYPRSNKKYPFSLALLGFVPEWPELSTLSYVLPLAVGIIGAATLIYKWLPKKFSENVSDITENGSDASSGFSEDLNDNVSDFMPEPSYQDLHPETEFINTAETQIIAPISPQASLDFSSYIKFSLEDLLSMDSSDSMRFMIFKQFKLAEIKITAETALKLKNWCIMAKNATENLENKQILIEFLNHLNSILNQF